METKYKYVRFSDKLHALENVERSLTRKHTEHTTSLFVSGTDVMLPAEITIVQYVFTMHKTLGRSAHSHFYKLLEF